MQSEKSKKKKINSADRANLELLQLSTSGEIKSIGFDRVRKLIDKLYPEKCLQDKNAIALGWASDDPRFITFLSKTSSDMEVHNGIVHNEDSPAAAIAEILFKSRNPVIRGLAASHRNAPPSFLKQSVAQGGAIEKAEALANLNTPDSTVIREMDKKDTSTQTALSIRLKNILRGPRKD